MAEADNRKREYASPRSAGWSKWTKAMVKFEQQGYQRRDAPRLGYYRSDIERFPVDSGGVYEWRAVREGDHKFVVYLGATADLSAEVLVYCKSGGRNVAIQIVFDEALNWNYEMEFRVLAINTEQTRERKRQSLLRDFDYAWNQDPMRQPLFMPAYEPVEN